MFEILFIKSNNLLNKNERVKRMKVLMFGWEFPPFNSGGLGTACHGLTKGLSRQGMEITLVLPRSEGNIDQDCIRILCSGGNSVKFRYVGSTLKPYATPKTYAQIHMRESTPPGSGDIYGSNLFQEVYRYSQEAKKIADEEEFDIIHCHDWLTYSAGIEAKKIANKKRRNVPLVVHVHATEFDRTVGQPNRHVYHQEKNGMDKADYIISVSNYTKKMITRHYGINPGKIHVVHNSIDIESEPLPCEEDPGIKRHHKVVLFLGRMTIQKGLDHFLWIAKRISEVDDGVRFIMAGSGDMLNYIIEEAANLGIGDRVLFTDFLSGNDVDRAYKLADVYVMPSISEPFGLTVLEAMKNSTPAVVSKQSGVSEVVRNCLTADFWDINEMANKILAVLNYPELKETLAGEGLNEIRNFSWDQSAKKCIDVYEKAILGVRW